VRAFLLLRFCGLFAALKRLFLVVAGFGAIAVRRWPAVFLINDLLRLFGWPLVLATPLRKSTNGNEGHYSHHHYLSHQPHHFRLSLLMPSCAHGREKESRCYWRQQDRCHKRNPSQVRFFRGKSNRRPEFSHGFELVRTVSCKLGKRSCLSSQRKTGRNACPTGASFTASRSR